jgi:DNA-binding response OmpR family regulator
MFRSHVLFGGIEMSGLKVLIVDDQPDIVESLASCVKQWGHEIALAYSGEQALSIAEMFTPHVVLLDIMMPDMDGYVVAKKLRRMGEITVVGVTALQGEEHRHKSWDSGFHFYLVKPVNPENLKKLLDGFERTLNVGEKAKESGIAALTKKLENRIKSREPA